MSKLIAQSHKSGSPGTVLRGARVCLVSTVPFFVQTQLKAQIEYLSACGARVTVVTSPGKESAVIKRFPIDSLYEIPMSRAIAPLRDLKALISLMLFLLRNPTDIVHSTTPKAGLLAALACSVTRTHTSFHTFTGQAWVGIGGIKGWLAKASDKLIGRLNTHCFADSPSQRIYLIEKGIGTAERISVIGAGSLAGVDLRRFDRACFPESDIKSLKHSLGIGESSRVILFVGRINVDKGIRELLEAFKDLRQMLSDDVHLLLVGPLDHSSGAGRGMSQNEFEGIPNVHWIGFSEAPERYMRVADILCIPSYREGFGTVVIEAAAMGVPAVGSNIYGLSDAIEDGVTGILVPPKGPDELCLALAKLLADTQLLASMGQAAKRRAREQFDSSVINAGLVHFYQQFLND